MQHNGHHTMKPWHRKHLYLLDLVQGIELLPGAGRITPQTVNNKGLSWCLCCQPDYAFAQTVRWSVKWDVIALTLMRHHWLFCLWSWATFHQSLSKFTLSDDGFISHCSVTMLLPQWVDIMQLIGRLGIICIADPESIVCQDYIAM